LKEEIETSVPDSCQVGKKLLVPPMSQWLFAVEQAEKFSITELICRSIDASPYLTDTKQVM
jgi:hypothetical protein